jgi:serine/threonine-protein kinase ATR
MLSLFFENHVLGIMSHFTDIIDSSVDRHSIADKKRALRAIEQLISLAKLHVSIAMPQVRLLSTNLHMRKPF